MGKLSPAGLAAAEGRLLPELEAAQARSRAKLNPLILSVAGTDPAERWDALSLGQQRQVVAGLIEPLLMSRTVRGLPFNPTRLATSKWAGDNRTWAELRLV